MKDKILAIGNYKDAPYHPFGGVDECLKEIFQEMELVCTDDPQLFLTLKKGEYKAVISYLDIWNSTLSEEESEALYSYVVSGGALLILHNGISIQSSKKLECIMGGKFLSHPAMEEIRFEMKPHAITEGCCSFSLLEEPYQFEMTEDKKEVFLVYLYKGKEYIGGWSKETGDGRLVFLTPGHTKDAFKNAEYIKLIKNSMKWCRKEVTER